MSRPLRSWEGGFDLERSTQYSFSLDFCQVIFLTFLLLRIFVVKCKAVCNTMLI